MREISTEYLQHRLVSLLGTEGSVQKLMQSEGSGLLTAWSGSLAKNPTQFELMSQFARAASGTALGSTTEP